MSEFVRQDGGRLEQRSLDDVLDVLSHYQRRAIVEHCRESSGHVHAIEDVVDRLQGLERERPGAVPEDDSLLSGVVHVHGPKLQDLGLVEYDVRSMEIRYYPDETVEQTLDAIESARQNIQTG